MRCVFFCVAVAVLSNVVDNATNKAYCVDVLQGGKQMNEEMLLSEWFEIVVCKADGSTAIAHKTDTYRHAHSIAGRERRKPDCVGVLIFNDCGYLVNQM